MIEWAFMSLLNHIYTPFFHWLSRWSQSRSFDCKTQVYTSINYNSDEIHNKDIDSSKKELDSAEIESKDETKAVWLKQLTA